jgi:enoyl-CoA hydratase/carnithine racemase
MNFVDVRTEAKIATVTLNRGKVNALNEAVVDQLRTTFNELETDETATAVILTGQGSFFSFGFDIPEFLSYAQDDFIRYLTKFTDLYAYLFTFPKPLVMAINGHAIAGGCMLAMAGDCRLMVKGKAKISLNEITFGSSLFAGSVAMLKFWVGSKSAQEIAYSGRMFHADEAFQLGLIDPVTAADGLHEEAKSMARELGSKDPAAFTSIKKLLREPVVAEMTARERASVFEFADIWYSRKTWENLQQIRIRD